MMIQNINAFILLIQSHAKKNHVKILKQNCEQFPDDYDSKCIMKSDNTGCILSKCSDMDIQKCGDFIPNDYENKCAAIGDTCIVISKECKDYGVNECKNVNPADNCFPDLDQKLCVSKNCEDLASTECDKYTTYDTSKKCLPEGERCRLKSCEDLTVSECESLVFDDYGLKCILENNKCKLSSCYKSTGTCESFIPLNPIFYCKEEPTGDCVLYSKKCEEISNDLCDLWNEKLKIGNEKCVQGEDKCKLLYEGLSNFSNSTIMKVLITVGSVGLILLLIRLLC